MTTNSQSFLKIEQMDMCVELSWGGNIYIYLFTHPSTFLYSIFTGCY